ncbi:MAG: hypothetical protein QXO70_00390 [Candidatus Pacearchaeota archaeon]
MTKTINEILGIIISIVLLASLYSFYNFSTIPKYLAIFSLIILTSIFTKKIIGYFLEIDVTTQIWNFQQYGFASRHKFKKPIPIGVLLPIFLFIFSYNNIKWLATMQTEFEIKPTKKIRKRKPWSFPEIRELDIALICFSGIISIIILALITFSLSREIAKLCLFYAFFNLLPIGKLDGTKLFFSSRVIYLITIMSLAAASIILLILQF